MDTSGTVQNPAQAAQSRILPLLDDLPEESLSVVEQFVRFLHEQAQRGMAVVAISEARGVEAKEERPPYRSDASLCPGRSCRHYAAGRRRRFGRHRIAVR